MGGMVTQPVKLTTIRSFGTFLGSRLRVSVATRGGACHCARGARQPRSDSTFSGASFGLTTLPSACDIYFSMTNQRTAFHAKVHINMVRMLAQPVKLTTFRCFGTFLGSRLRVSVATRSGAFHCARGA